VVVLEGLRLVGVVGDGPGSCSGGLVLGEEAMVCELISLERYFIRMLSRNWKAGRELKLLSFVYQCISSVLTTSTTLPQQQSAQRVRRNPPENRREDNAIMSTSACCIEFAIEAPAGMNEMNE
jgi:hypothetical protein